MIRDFPREILRFFQKKSRAGDPRVYRSCRRWPGIEAPRCRENTGKSLRNIPHEPVVNWDTALFRRSNLQSPICWRRRKLISTSGSASTGGGIQLPSSFAFLPRTSVCGLEYAPGWYDVRFELRSATVRTLPGERTLSLSRLVPVKSYLTIDPQHTFAASHIRWIGRNGGNAPVEKKGSGSIARAIYIRETTSRTFIATTYL